ncbi:BCL-6 corepressor-like protein [Lates japonicus]|uniref:BCL-6 corepressor-like protein n=1 Tax=Lates japonicus TaxID=270547 RepID=A0AAD3R1W1_LATJO|nr:BCL-6 corepressor-like protein [Lates japonicus]
MLRSPIRRLIKPKSNDGTPHVPSSESLQAQSRSGPPRLFLDVGALGIYLSDEIPQALGRAAWTGPREPGQGGCGEGCWGGEWERWGREEPCRGARSGLINEPRVTAIKVACQRRGSEAQRRFSAMIEEPNLSAALSTAEHGKASLLLFKGTSLCPATSVRDVDAETQTNLELRQGNHITQNMVDARLTPLAAMGLDRGTLMHDGLRLHSGVVYPGIRALPTEKSRETPTLPLAYNRDGLPELIYKPDGPLDSRKPVNGYLGLYKGTPPSLHKPVLVPGAEGLGLERRVGPGEKASELGLASAGGSYLRLPWLSPYPEASMYPFMDTSKYAALNMYKASLLSQPNPYLPQHLAYPSLCAAQGG